MMVILFMTLIVAILSVTRRELKSSDLYESSVRADQLSEIAKSIVISQIRTATEFNSTENLSWASQPGAIRRYSGEGKFYSGHKLYSDSRMNITEADGEAKLAEDAPPADWNKQPVYYVDLNEPVIRSGWDGEQRTYFPIIDPRAAYDDPETWYMLENIDGFSFDGEIAGLVNEGDGEKWRVPMPVEWLYVLEDGTVGYLNENKRFEPAGKASPTNPIVGRIAFWTDDECCKININTASEPTYWATPSLGDKTDWGWAKVQPGTGEYQRFPGHPATTALSPVLLPGLHFSDPPFPDQTGRISPHDLRAARTSADQKGKFYDWAPKVQDIGSKAGTEFVQYSRRFSSQWKGPKKNYRYKDEYDPEEAKRERLYASVDEFLLDPNRDEHDFTFTDYEISRGTGGRRSRAGTRGPRVNEETLMRVRAFLTAHSRAPETTLYGTPRIAVWPLHEQASSQAGWRTHFDDLIARCATLGPMAEGLSSVDNSYFFRRAQSEDPGYDISIGRNKELLSYLRRLTSRPAPGYGESFVGKYGNDRDQILVEIFDYIRSTNTYDPYLASEGNENLGDFKTYTAGRKKVVHKGVEKLDFGDGASHFEPGHGHVVPSFSEDWNCQGFGRTLTIDEVAMLFICCADGTPNDHNQYTHLDDPWTGGAAGIRRSAASNSADPSNFAQSRQETFVYSNFPPDIEYIEELEERNPYGDDRDHPGYKRKNWNYCLNSKEPLQPQKKRIQGMLLLDYFNPAPGYNPLRGRFGLKVSGLKHLQIDGTSLYHKDSTTFWRTIGTPNAHISVGSGLAGKTLGKRDPYSQSADKLPGDLDRLNDLVTKFIDVDSESMTFGATGPLHVELISQQDKNSSQQILQSFSIRFPRSLEIPSPRLVLEGKRGDGRFSRDRDPHPPEGWDSQRDGRWERLVNFYPQPRYFWSFFRKGFNRQSRGRTIDAHKGAGIYGKPEPGDFVYPRPNFDVVYSLVPWHGDYRLTGARRNIGTDPRSPYKVDGKGWEFAPLPGAPSFEEGRFGSHMFEHKLKGRKNELGHGKVWERSRSRVRNQFTPYELADLSWPRPNVKGSGRSPHFPATKEATNLSRRYGDFDIGFGRVQGGSFINKPDEGSLAGAEQGRDNEGNVVNPRSLRGREIDFVNRIPYFSNFSNSREPQDGFFSPNRMVPSPVMMGSLPSGVKARDPWRTLLFRPDVNSLDEEGQPDEHPGAKSPPDHLLLDLFWMPVVEPYAISEPFSTSGKINLNYQILPFIYIKRETAMHGLLKDQRIPSLPVSRDPAIDPTFRQLLWHDASGRVWRRNFLYRPINVEKTLEAFQEKFEEDHTLFRSASQICEMHLVPEPADLPSQVRFNEGLFRNERLDTEQRMKAFWKTYRGTPDNLRERPYAYLYSRVTTQTNTWRIHYRVQRIKKYRQSPPDTFDPEFDGIAAEQRGAALIERYINPNEPDLPDFTQDSEARIDDRYRYRVLSKRRFSL